MDQDNSVPPRDGSITVMPGFVDFQAQHRPNDPWVIFPSKTEPQAIESVSFSELAEASHRIAHFVRPEKKGNDGEVVVIVANCDALLYTSLLVGIIRAELTVCINLHHLREHHI